MTEWLEGLLTAIGGSMVALIGTLTIFKGLFVKLFETGVESLFEKNFEKFKNRLERSTRAYEVLLNREMRFYENIEPIIAELVPVEHDLLYYLKYDEDIEHKLKCEDFEECFKKYCNLIKKLKNESITHNTYIPQEINAAFTAVVKQMQDDVSLWFNMAKLLFESKYDKIDYEKCKKAVDLVMLKLAFAETLVRKRLKQLSGEE